MSLDSMTLTWNFVSFLMWATSNSGLSNSGGSRDTCSPAHSSILTEFFNLTVQVSLPCSSSMKDHHSKLGEKTTAYKEQKWNQAICSWKGEQRDTESSVCPSTTSLSQPKAAQPSPATLSLPPAVHSCGLPSSSTIWSQSEQGSWSSRKWIRHKQIHQWLKKILLLKTESASWPVCGCVSSGIGEGWVCTAEGPGWGGMRKKHHSQEEPGFRSA